MRKRKDCDIAAVEHCKDYTREIFQSFMNGGITVDIAISAVWHKMDLMLLEMHAKELSRTVRLRVAAPAHDTPPSSPGLISCRCIGAKNSEEEGDPTGEDVYYLVIEAASYEKALETIRGLRGNGFKVRDWEFYA